MRQTIYAGTMLTALFLLGSGVPGVAMESKSDNTSRHVQEHETILDVDENRIFEFNRESVHSRKPNILLEGRTEDSKTMPSTATGQEGMKIVEIDHDFVLHP